MSFQDKTHNITHRTLNFSYLERYKNIKFLIVNIKFLIFRVFQISQTPNKIRGFQRFEKNLISHLISYDYFITIKRIFKK